MTCFRFIVALERFTGFLTEQCKNLGFFSAETFVS